jgi:hypothetical protein
MVYCNISKDVDVIAEDSVGNAELLDVAWLARKDINDHVGSISRKKECCDADSLFYIDCLDISDNDLDQDIGIVDGLIVRNNNSGWSWLDY